MNEDRGPARMAPGTAWPSGVVTFFFSDIEDSTPLWDRHRAAMRPALAAHDDLLRAAVSANGGVTVKTTGDGIHAVFASATDAVSCALDAQRALHDATWPTIDPDHIRVRIGLHTGEAEQRAGDYFGTAVIRAARLMSIGHGGQILISGTTADRISGALPAGVELQDLGEHQLKGLARAGRVFQVNAPGLPRTFPPLRTGSAVKGNLPQPLTDFIGREQELARIKQLLGQTRLLTLAGPGGTGKTRLSLEVGRHVQGQYDHGVWLAELAPLSTGALLPTTIAALFDLREQAGVPITDSLIDYLRSKKLLLILDNCEHIVAACAELCAGLLPTAPQLTILASSREGLGVPGEKTVRVPAMTMPASGLSDSDDVAQFESVRLFVSRARQADQAFDLTDDNAAAVGQIVRRLDGIPLAIELAAARIKLLTPGQIAARLDDRFRLLTGGSRTALARQQTLRALIDWSYDLLDEDERWFLRQMAVFAGGWTLEAAEAMVAGHEAGPLDALDLLANLVNKSLVHLDDVGGEMQYHYLETIRQYALDRLLEAGEAPAARDRHFRYFERLTREAYGDTLAIFIGMGGGERLDNNLDNLRAALDWGAVGDPVAAAYLLHRLSGLWAMHGLSQDTRRRARGLLQDLDHLLAADEQAAREQRLARAAALGALAAGTGISGGSEEGYRAAEEAVAILREDGTQPVALGNMLYWQAVIALEIGLPQSLDAARACYDIGVQLQNRVLQHIGLVVMARAELIQGDIEAATGHLAQARQLQAGLNNPILVVYQAFAESLATRAVGDFEGAKRALAMGVEALRQVRLRVFANILDSELGHTLRASGDLRGAAAIYRRTILEWQDLGHRAAVANQLECLAFIAVRQQRDARAARFFGAAEKIRSELSSTMTASEAQEYDAHVATLREAMDDAELETVWQEGRQLSLDGAIALALEETG